MKSKLSIIISLLLLLFSCSEEGPFNMGNTEECKVNINALTPTTAVITIEIPQNNPNFLINEGGAIFLSSNPSFNDSPGSWYIIYDSSNKDKYVETIRLDNLKPNTTYYVFLEVYVNFNGTNDFYQDYNDYNDFAYYYSGYSFTTPKEGDYSGLGELYCKLIEPENGYTRVEITLPDNLYIFRNCSVEASETPDMKNAIKAFSYHALNEGNIVIIASFKNMKSGVYYLRLHGDFAYGKPNTDNLFFDGISLNVKNTLEIPNTEEQVLP